MKLADLQPRVICRDIDEEKDLIKTNENKRSEYRAKWKKDHPDKDKIYSQKKNFNRRGPTKKQLQEIVICLITLLAYSSR